MMKTITDFKNRMKVGAIVNSELYHKKPDGSTVLKQKLKNRTCTIVQTKNFALSYEYEGKTGDSWADWPKKENFVIINENTVQIEFEGGYLIYEFVIAELKLDNIMKVGDISDTKISVKTIAWLREHGEITYKDQLLKEHIYNIDGTIESMEENECDEKTEQEILAIHAVLQKNDCGYLRIIYH